MDSIRGPGCPLDHAEQPEEEPLEEDGSELGRNAMESADELILVHLWSVLNGKGPLPDIGQRDRSPSSGILVKDEMEQPRKFDRSKPPISKMVSKG